MAQLYSFILQLNQNIIQDIKGSVKDILKAQEEEKTRKKDSRWILNDLDLKQIDCRRIDDYSRSTRVQ